MEPIINFMKALPTVIRPGQRMIVLCIVRFWMFRIAGVGINISVLRTAPTISAAGRARPAAANIPPAGVITAIPGTAAPVRANPIATAAINIPVPMIITIISQAAAALPATANIRPAGACPAIPGTVIPEPVNRSNRLAAVITNIPVIMTITVMSRAETAHPVTASINHANVCPVILGTPYTELVRSNVVRSINMSVVTTLLNILLAVWGVLVTGNIHHANV